MTTKGMHAVGQAEVVVLLQCLPEEKAIPKDIFKHFVHLYQEALSGKMTALSRRDFVSLLPKLKVALPHGGIMMPRKLFEVN